jgi:hypothetical protein
MQIKEMCDFTWPQSEKELARSVSDCDHFCQLDKGHKGPHTYCSGRAVFKPKPKPTLKKAKR